MQHCFSTSLYKSALFPETLCLLENQNWFYSCIYKGLCFDVTCNCHYLVLPSTKLLIFISIKCQAFSPVKHILSPRIYVHKSVFCICMLAHQYKTSSSAGAHTWPNNFLHPFSFLVQLTDFSFPFLFSKISCFLLWNTMVEFFHLFFAPLSGQSYN